MREREEIQEVLWRMIIANTRSKNHLRGDPALSSPGPDRPDRESTLLGYLRRSESRYRGIRSPSGLFDRHTPYAAQHRSGRPGGIRAAYIAVCQPESGGWAEPFRLACTAPITDNNVDF